MQVNGFVNAPDAHAFVYELSPFYVPASTVAGGVQGGV